MRARPRKCARSGVCALAVAVLSVFSIAVSAKVAWSQTGRTIKLVVPYPPGGGIDVLARIVADGVGRMQGPAVVVENRPGAGTEIGTEMVARAVPDGNTLLVTNNAIAILPHFRKLGFDPLEDLVPICNLASTPSLLVVNSNSPYRTLEEFFRAARSNPGGLTYGSAPGGTGNIGFEMIAHAAGVRLTFVPFGGTPPAINAVLGGHIDAAAMVDYPSAAGQLQAGKLRALVTTSARRLAALPDVPTTAESGFKDYDVQVWYALFAPAKTPKEITSQLAVWFTRAVQAPEIKSKLDAEQLGPVAVCGADFAAYLRKLHEHYGRAIREMNIRQQ